MQLDDTKVKITFFAIVIIVIIVIIVFSIQPKTSTTKSETNSPAQNSPTQNPSVQNSMPQQITIINSYNTNSYNELSDKKSSSTTTYKNKETTSNFKSWSTQKSERGMWENTVDKYIVYVENTENEGRYVKVIFTLEDCFGKTNSDSITKYVYPKDEEKFVYTDIKNKYCDWDYEISN